MKQRKDLYAQALSFAPVLMIEGQPEPIVLDAEGNVYLQIRADNAEKVEFLIADQRYECVRDTDGIWKLKYPQRTGINLVQLLIDDTPVLTPWLPIGHGYSRPYNIVPLETLDDEFYRIKDVPHGSVRREYYFSEVTQTWASCLVYTPPVYDCDTTQEFPVLYLQHGYGENETGWVNMGKVNFILDNLLAEEKISPFVVVMNDGMVQTEDEEGRSYVDHTLFEKRLIKDIIPFIESKFRVKKEKEGRAMAGLSMGSIQTSITGFKHPEYFSALGLFSGFMHDFLQGSELDMVKREGSKNEHLCILDNPERFQEEFKVFFRAIGKEDMLIEEFMKDDVLCNEKGIVHCRNIYEGIHDWNVWRKCIYDFAQLIFRR